MGLVSQGQPYFSATSLATKLGDWIAIGEGLHSICWEFDFQLGGGNVTGALRVEHTAQLNGTLPANGSRIGLPLGSLHTTLTQAVLALAPNPSQEVTLTAVVSGRLALILGAVPAGNIRCSYIFASGAGASPNLVVCNFAATSRGSR